MPEEFIEDIIAASEVATDEETPVVTDTPAVEETTEVSDTTNPDEAQTDEPATPSPVEELASKLGWSADHKSENFVDAETYILRSREIQDSMRDHNRDLKSQLNDLQGSVEALKSHNERVYKTEITKLQSQLDSLNNEKDAAIEMADKDKVNQLDKQIDAVKRTLSEPEPKPAPPSTNPVYDDWVKDNSWYVTDNEMATYANTVAQQYAGAPADRVYALVRQRVAEVWPEKFEEVKPVTEKQTPLEQVATETKQPKTAKPIAPASPVEGATNSGATPSFTKADLTDDQRKIMNDFVRLKVMTEDQYIADIAKLQGE